MADVRIEIQTIADKAISDIKKTAGAVDGLDKSAKQASGGSDKLTAGLGKLAGALSVAGLLLKAANAAKQFSKDSLEAAARSQELTAKFNTVFGTSAPKATAALEEFGDAVHRSNLDLKEMGADMQNVLVGMGTAREKSSDMSVELVKLAVDVAAFNNAADADVLNNFQSALTGNAIAAKKYGIILDENNMNAALFKMGIEGGTTAATNAEKVMARYNIIMESTADAHGAAANEADSYTNVSKGLAAAMLELQVVVGNQLIPTMTKLKLLQTEVINGLTENIERSTLLKQAEEAGVISKEQYRDATHRASMADEYSIEKLHELIAAHERENGVIVDTLAYTRELTQVEMNYQGALDAVTAAQLNLEQAQQGWLESTANEVVSALDGLEDSAGNYMDALGVVDEVLGTTKQSEEEHSRAVDDIVEAYGETGNLEEFRSALAGLKDAELPQTTDELNIATEAAWDLYRILLEIQGMGAINVHVNYRQLGSPTGGGDRGGAVSGSQGVAWASGVENFKVPPGYPNDSFIAGLTSGEIVTVKTGGDTSNSNAISVYGDLVVNSGGGLSTMDILADIRL